MTQLQSAPLFQLKAQPEGVLEGYASVFGGRDSFGDQVAPGAFAATLMQHRSAGSMPVMLWSHAASRPVGRWTAMSEDSRGLHVAGKLNLATAGGRDAHAHVAQGDLSGLSIGYEISREPGSAEVKGDTRLLKRLDLHEISLVALPADLSARVTSIKSSDGAEPPASLAQFEDALRVLGFSRREARHIAIKGFASFTAEPADELDPDQLRAAHAALISLTKSLKA